MEGLRTSPVERAVREARSRALARLIGLVGDFDRAEDVLQEATLRALERWPARGVPSRPAAWLVTVGKRIHVDGLRRRATAREGGARWREQRLEDVETDVADIPDERLRLIFTCCHPALSESARTALTLQVVCGLPARTVARLLLRSEGAVAQELVRAKRKIRVARIPYRVPDPEQWEARLSDVLRVIYLVFTEGFATRSGDRLVRTELVEAAIGLGRVALHLVPTEPEVGGLYALMRLHDARRAARADERGLPVPLGEQDRSLWDRDAIAEGQRVLESALRRGRPGPYQVQAAIAALHADARRSEDTDWPQIAALYSVLEHYEPTPVVALAHSVALGMAEGPAAGLARLDALAASGRIEGYHRLHAARADCLERLGRRDEAIAAWRQALAAGPSAPEAGWIAGHLAGLQDAQGS